MIAILTPIAQASPAQGATSHWLPVALIIAVAAAALLVFAAWANAPWRNRKDK